MIIDVEEFHFAQTTAASRISEDLVAGHAWLSLGMGICGRRKLPVGQRRADRFHFNNNLFRSRDIV
jgi:hypothetical protein